MILNFNTESIIKYLFGHQFKGGLLILTTWLMIQLFYVLNYKNMLRIAGLVD